jgi:hypothetical protein
VIKFVKDEAADLMTNGEPLQITESMVRRAPRLHKWCLKCNRITEHLYLSGGLKGGMVHICNEEEG